MPVNLIDPSAITAFLDAQAGGDREIALWLRLALGKSLRRRPESAIETIDLPDNPPTWLQKKWTAEGPFHTFHPDPALIERVGHIRDWLMAAREEKAPFLQRMDATGQPMKLHHLDLDAASHAADKFFARLNQQHRMDASEDHTSTVMTFKGGFRMVQMLTPEALKAEGRRMGSCLGTHGGKLLSGETAYFSLRDHRDDSHATLSRLKNNVLSECKGRRNKPVLAEYLPLIATFLKEMKITMQRYSRDLNSLLQDTSGELHILNSLPSPFAWPESLEIRDNENLTRLPADLAVQGNLLLHGCHHLEEPGHFLTVGGSLELRGCPKLRALPRQTHVGASLLLDDCGLERLPPGLAVRDSLIVSRCPRLTELDLPLHGLHSLVVRHCTALTRLPEGLSLARDLEITRCPQLKHLPQHLSVGGRIITDRGVFTSVESARLAFAGPSSGRRGSR
jgi:hypothetical protein